MTTTRTAAPAFRYLDRPPVTSDIVTITPTGTQTFEVIALDEVYGECVLVAPLAADDERDPFWHPLTYVRVIDDEAPDGCTCGHPDCGAC